VTVRTRQVAAASRPNRPGGFSLIEVVIVVVILAAVVAIALPRLSRGSQGSTDAALARDVQVMQKSIDLYAADHNGAFPDPAMIADQLTQYTDAQGSMSRTRSSPYTFGPYLRKVPAVPCGPNKGSSHISTAAGIGVGWIYDPAEGTITANNATAPISATQPVTADSTNSTPGGSSGPD
jgi:prepilin-type N-terminal cleavage/methylation domain-containing protein